MGPLLGLQGRMWATFSLRLPEGGEQWGRVSLYLASLGHIQPHIIRAPLPGSTLCPSPAVCFLVPMRLSTFLHVLLCLGHEVPLPDGKAMPSLVL